MGNGRLGGRTKGMSAAVLVCVLFGPVSPATAGPTTAPTTTAPTTPAPATGPTTTATSGTARPRTPIPSSTITEPTPSTTPIPSTPASSAPSQDDAPKVPSVTASPQAEPPHAEPPRTDEVPLTPAEVQAQLEQAAALAAQRRATDAALQAATEQLQALGRQTAVAQAQLATARAEQLAAQKILAGSTQQLGELRADLGVSHEEMGQWARETYSHGGAMSAYEGWLVALDADSSADVARNLAALEQLGLTGSATVRRLERSVSEQTQLQQRAALAAAQARAASARTSAALQQLQGLQRRATVAAAQLRVQQARLLGSDQLSAQQRANLVQAEAIVGAAAGSTTAGSPGTACVGLNTSDFSNGAIPSLALCPVWGAPGQLLRADAAAALSALSRDYAAEFGRPLCLTDSYRTLAIQVRLKATKPRLAARPGTSNHGWGTAVDLCGGIQSFGTVQHAWMLAHAPMRGWFHPAWAEPTGSKPEPWHWELAS